MFIHRRPLSISEVDNFKTNGRIKTKFGSAAQNWSAIVPMKFSRVYSGNVENIRKHFVFSLIMDHSVYIYIVPVMF